MFRFCYPLILLATPLLAQDQAELCTVSAEIAGLAVTERAAGAAQDRTAETITIALDGPRASYTAAVEPIVAWVYSLPEEQLTADVAMAYEAACLAQ
ncbi:DNA primase [Roseovarius faecimaris]|uniref:DNA primase n=1 Tax=Roseovarius faecimaris TaxID=2494550 RepID=A0A6I6IPR5_9RHOB|nr:DNA primase [Roseovarius faecimaris]QGX99039.1 DNA primase [Roseovarius faecimaris]